MTHWRLFAAVCITNPAEQPNLHRGNQVKETGAAVGQGRNNGGREKY